jgi:phosphodiesterase/alkaline phosphatase D-like protein
MRYTATGSPPTLVAIAGSGSACRFALGPEGKIYMADVYGRGVERWTVVGFEKQITSNGYGVIYDSASEHLFVTANDQVDEYTTEGVLLSETGRGAPFDQTGIGTMSNATGVAVRESTGDLYVAARGSNIVNVYGPLGAFPDVTTGNASQITRTGATVAGEVVPAGGNVSSCQVEWGSSTAYGNTTSCAQPTPFAGPTPVSASLSGLAAGATYHYRIVAANEAGANYSGDQTFTTNFVDGVTTGAATDISRSEATLDGSLEPSGIDAHYYFEWGIDQGYGSTTPVPPGTDAGSGVGIAAASAAVGSLQFGTTYHYRLVASNADGTNYGQDQTFRTLDAVVGLETTAATGMTQTGATLNGKLDPDGLATTYYFEWGPTTAYGTNAPSGPPGASAGGGLGITAVSAPIDGLSSYTTYHYRLVATNSVGTTYGADQTLTTQPPLLPVISETSASNLGANSATLSAQINPGFGQTVYRFQYGRDASYEFRTPPIGPLSDDNVDHPVSLDVTELVAGVTYHYRVVATNFAGVTRGPDRTFTTESPPKIESASATSVTPHGARIEVQVNPGFAATTFHVEYGDGLALATPESGVIGADGGNHAGSVDLAALNAGTTYHYEVVASNAIGTTTGQDQTFTTPAEQTSLPPPPVVKCKKGTVRRHGKCVKKPRRHQKRHNRGRS